MEHLRFSRDAWSNLTDGVEDSRSRPAIQEISLELLPLLKWFELPWCLVPPRPPRIGTPTTGLSFGPIFGLQHQEKRGIGGVV
jgi:hypothetical protein